SLQASTRQEIRRWSALSPARLPRPPDALPNQRLEVKPLHLGFVVCFFSRTCAHPCRPLNVTSAIPLLSSCPSPSATSRSYCSFVAAASGSCRPASAPSTQAIVESFAACAAEK